MFTALQKPKPAPKKDDSISKVHPDDSTTSTKQQETTHPVCPPSPVSTTLTTLLEQREHELRTNKVNRSNLLFDLEYLESLREEHPEVLQLLSQLVRRVQK
jgi:hypothetical protein